jgi:hypothetical protein
MRSTLGFAVLLVAVSLLTVGCQQVKEATGMAPNIRGSYMLDYRELSDGKQLRAPNIQGIMTFTRHERNFNIYWVENGKPVSTSMISKYSFDGKTYTEENTYYAGNSPDSGGIKYSTEITKGSADVKHEDGRWEFKLPLFNEPDVVFTKDSLTATRTGAFVDHWKKVE